MTWREARRRAEMGLALLLVLESALACSCIRPAPPPVTTDLPPGAVSNAATPDVLETPTEARLAAGKRAAMRARWEEAENAFRDVYGDGSAKVDVRAEALYQLGELYSDFLNPNRSGQQAIAWFQQLLDEFPNAHLAPDAATRIEELKIEGEPQSPIRQVDPPAD